MIKFNLSEWLSTLTGPRQLCKLSALILLFLSHSRSTAQTSTVSLRTGVLWSRPDHPFSRDGFTRLRQSSASWLQELSYSRLTRHGVSFEASLQHYQELLQLKSLAWADYSGEILTRSEAFGVRLAAGYDIMQPFRRQSRFRLPVRGIITPTLYHQRVHHQWTGFSGQYRDDRYSGQQFGCFAGITVNPTFRLNRHWQLDATLSFQRRLFRPLTLNSYYTGDMEPGTTALGVAVGIGYLL